MFLMEGVPRYTLQGSWPLQKTRLVVSCLAIDYPPEYSTGNEKLWKKSDTFKDLSLTAILS
ncbi:MAG: hypothetical protein CVV48_08900 [Spirochaetae bacterium HGW-Spirochaetae-4]|nr:MAG: hypothetical protein CVV48_08900 [Spirochaetae bacterium HGW-Spirochaetae-4]HCG63645.1 hypothetical protein [Sphaerochaeta sp.]